MKVSDAMHGPAEWVEADTPVKEIAARMEKDDIGAVPIGRDDKLVGMVTDRDIALRVAAKGLDAAKTTAEQVMTKGVIFCRDEESVEDAVHLMDQRKIRRQPVLDKDKRMIGMLSLGDVAHASGLQLAGELARAVADHHR
jgi:CBS domain-containing protein